MRLTGHFDVPDDRLADVTRALLEHIRLTRAEPGCRLFDVQADPDVPGRFTVAEDFVDRTAFEAHQARVAGSAWAAASEGLTRHYRIEDTDA